MGAYAHYTMVTLSGANFKCKMGCHPEMMRASLKAFSNFSEMEADIKELVQLFPPGKNDAWVATSSDGDFFALPDSLNMFDKEWLKKNSKNIYNASCEKLPNLHKYKPFLIHKDIPESSLLHYNEWKSVTTAFLKKNGIPVMLGEFSKKITTKSPKLQSAIAKKRAPNVVQIAKPLHASNYVLPKYCVIAEYA